MERVRGRSGELALRRAGDDYEIISNGVFLMDTRNGESERLLVSAALGRLGRPGHIVIGGLGVGFSLAQAVRHPNAERVTVIEREPAVIGWHDGPLRPFSGGALDDPRVSLVEADLVSWLEAAASRAAAHSERSEQMSSVPYDVICVDIDNGPDWTVTPANARLYGDEGLGLLKRRLAPGGVLAVWSAMAAPGFEARLRARFSRVEVLNVEVPRGEPDAVYLAQVYKGK